MMKFFETDNYKLMNVKISSSAQQYSLFSR